MSQIDSIVGRVEIKSPIEKFYGFYRNHLGDLINLFPELFQTIDLVEGQHFSAGCVMLFIYHLGHEVVSEKWSMKVLDDAKRYIIFEAIEGDMKKYYKVLRAKIDVVNYGGLSKVGGSCFAKWTFEYEKAYENVPSPANYMELFLKVAKGVDAHLSKQH